jgi:hypothetical protein
MKHAEIEAARIALNAVIAMNDGFSDKWYEDRWGYVDALCSAALRSSREPATEAVRNEALEEAANVCEAAIAELDITDEVLKVDDYFKGFKAAVGARARAIRALKREPNAAVRREGHKALIVRDGKLETFDPHPTEPSPAAAPDVAEMVKRLNEMADGTRHPLADGYETIRQAAALLARLGQSQSPFVVNWTTEGCQKHHGQPWTGIVTTYTEIGKRCPLCEPAPRSPL